MKKIILLVVSLLSVTSIVYSQKKEVLRAPNSRKKTVNCAECCKAGRTVSKECCEQCNGCQMYNDNGKAECGDFPS